MGAVSKNVVAAGEWCAPTRELKNSQLLALVHKTRKIVRETLHPVHVERIEDVVLLVDKKPAQVEPARFQVSGVPVYPVLRDRWRPVRALLAVSTIAAFVGLCVMVVW